MVNPDGSARYTEDDGYIPREAPPFRWSRALRVGGGRLSSASRSWLGRGGAKGLAPLGSTWSAPLPVPGKGKGGPCLPGRRRSQRGRLVWGYLNPATDFGWLPL